MALLTRHLIVFLLLGMVGIGKAQQRHPLSIVLAGGGVCNVPLSKQERMNRIRANILDQMGLSEAPENPKVPVLVRPEKMEEIKALERTLGAKRGSPDEVDDESSTCTDIVTFARRIVSFPAGEVSTPEKTNNWKYDYAYHFDHYHHYYGKRDAGSSQDTFMPTPIKYSFKFNVDMKNERMFSSAELVLRKLVISPPPRVELTEFETVQVQLVQEQLTKDPITGHIVRKELREMVDIKLVQTISDEFVTFDVTHGMDQWFNIGGESSGSIQFDIVIKVPELMKSHRKLPPLIKFETDQNSAAESPSFNNDTDTANAARLVISLINPEEITDASSSGRRRRRQASTIRLDAEYCFENPTEPNCCVRELAIDFEKDLEWTWVLSPKVYYPNYCTGLCPFFWPRVSDSTFLLQKYRSLNPTGAVEPCCAPDVLKPLVLMFIIGGEPLLQVTNNMVVESCICR